MLMNTKEMQFDALQAALEEAEASGPAEPFDFDAFIADQKKCEVSIEATETPPR
jgi:hypothetical protein